MNLVVMAACVLAAVAMFAATGRAEIKVESVEYKHGETVLAGWLAYDDAAKEARPGVLVCHEWWGCNDYARSRAEQLARAGFVAFALDMYGKGVTTEDPKKAGELAGGLYKDMDVARGRAAAGLKVLTDSTRVDKTRVAAIGYCMGGTVALELARTGAELKAVVCFHTSTLTAKNAEDNKKIKASVLVCHGAADGFVKAEEIEGFQKQMTEAKVDWQMVSYAEAVHSFTNPGVDKHKLDGAKYQEKADKRSWGAMLGLFKEVVGN